jgi:hypothetical protein
MTELKPPYLTKAHTQSRQEAWLHVPAYPTLLHRKSSQSRYRRCHRFLRRKGGYRRTTKALVGRVGDHYAVKYGKDVHVQEGENMLSIHQHASNVSIPTIYALFHVEETGHNFIVCEYIAGIKLSLVWDKLDASDKAAIRQSLSKLRNIPAPGYYGGIWRQPTRDIGSGTRPTCQSRSRNIPSRDHRRPRSSEPSHVAAASEPAITFQRCSADSKYTDGITSPRSGATNPSLPTRTSPRRI